MIYGPMKLVVIESPFAGDTDRNVAYARAAMLDCLRRGEAPYASHLLMPQVLDDALPHERETGMRVGFEWGRAAQLVAVYQDLGVSSGMQRGIAIAGDRGIAIEYRNLDGWT